MRTRTVNGTPLPLGLVLVACLLSCGPRSDAPRLEKVSPDHAFFGAPERLLLSGSFAPDLAVDLGSDAPPSLENRFEVRIGSERAYGVRFLSRDSLEATAPASLPPGHHDVTVTDAQGHASTLPGAFEVVDRTVSRLVFVTSMRSAHPDAWTEPIRLELRDASGLPAPTSTPRTLRITSDSSTGRFARLGGEASSAAELELTLAPGEWGVDLRYQDATPGYHTLESSSLELSPIAQTVAVGRLGPPTSVRFTRVPASPLVAGEPMALAVEVLDSSGGPASLPATGIQLELSTTSPGGGLAVMESDPYGPALSLVLLGGQGRLPLLYRDTRASAEAWLSAHAFNKDTLQPLLPDEVALSVRAGPTRRFELQRSGTGPLQAGVPEHFVLHALDAYGNPTPYTGPVLLDPLPADPDFSPGRVDVEAGQAAFDASFTRVQTVAVVAASPNAAGVSGASEELSVRPGPPARLVAFPVEGPQLAGKAFPLTLQVLDRFGNLAETPLAVTLSMPGVPEGALSPTTSGTFTGALTLPVTLTTALDEARIDIIEGTPETRGALHTTTGGFAVLPGVTQRFVVEDTPGPQTAGVKFRVRIRAVDTYGNTTRDVHELQLGAEGVHAHLFSPADYPGFQGQADVDVTVLQALPGTRVTVLSGTAKGQQSSTFAINPGAFAGFQLQVPGCITERDRWKLTLRAIDAWGNLVTDYTGTAQLATAPFGNIDPALTKAFGAGTTTEPNVIIGEMTGRAPYSCLQLVATDTKDSGKTGVACLNLQTSCPTLR